MRLIYFSTVIAALASSGALAQAVGGGGPAQGSTDAARASSNLRNENASYNRLVGSMDKPVKKGRAVAAEPGDILPGSQLRDLNGLPVGTVESIEGDNAVVATTLGKVKIPLIGFGKDKVGLLLSITAAELETAILAAPQG